MLRRILHLMQQSGGVPLTVETIGRQLGVPRDLADQLVLTLVRRGRLVEVDDGCVQCTSCPLKVVCAGAPQVPTRGYALAQDTHIPASTG